MKIKVTMTDMGRVKDIERDNLVTDWVTSDTQIVKLQPVLPALPDYLLPVVYNYIKGTPISKDMKIVPASGQYWNELKNEQQAKLLELVEWLGGSAEEYVRHFESMYPNDPEWKRKR